MVTPKPSPTYLGSANIKILFKLLAETYSLPGQIAECGVYRGGTLIPMALFLKDLGSFSKVYGFDSFHGFDESVNRDILEGGVFDPQKRVGGFSNTSYEYLTKKINWFGLGDRIELVPGYFGKTLQEYSNLKFSFVHLDCDLYESYKTCLEFFYFKMVPGGRILFDEYKDPHWPGCQCAVDEFFSDKPEQPQQIILDNYIKYTVHRLDESGIGQC
jgi:hypothetical protein